jgi:hypothetical protein
MRKSIVSALLGVMIFSMLPCQAQETSLYVLVLDNLSSDSTFFKVSHYPKMTTSEKEFTISVGDSAQVTFPMASCFFKLVTMDDSMVTPITDSIDQLSEGTAFEPGKAFYKGLRPGSAVRVYSSDGRLLDSVTADSSGHAEIDYSGLPSGKVYILRSEKKSIKIIK